MSIEFKCVSDIIGIEIGKTERWRSLVNIFSRDDSYKYKDQAINIVVDPKSHHKISLSEFEEFLKDENAVENLKNKLGMDKLELSVSERNSENSSFTISVCYRNKKFTRRDIVLCKDI